MAYTIQNLQDGKVVAKSELQNSRTFFFFLVELPAGSYEVVLDNADLLSISSIAILFDYGLYSVFILNFVQNTKTPVIESNMYQLL